MKCSSKISIAYNFCSLIYRFLATGESLHSLQFQFRVSVSEISQIIRKTLAALRKKLVSLFLPSLTSRDLQEKAKEFLDKWDFPNCCGAIDGKHVRIVCPKLSGSLCYNYKGYFSTVLLAVVDANCKFMFVDIGSYGNKVIPEFSKGLLWGGCSTVANFFHPQASCRIPT